MVTDNIELVTTAACPTAVVETKTTRAELPATIGKLLDQVWAYVRASDLVTNHNVVLYRGDISSRDGATVEIGVQVDRPFEGTTAEGIRCSELPATRVARAVHRGPYDGLGDTHAAVIEWCNANGHRVTGRSWEIYGDWDDDPAKLETEVAYEVAT